MSGRAGPRRGQMTLPQTHRELPQRQSQERRRRERRQQLLRSPKKVLVKNPHSKAAQANKARRAKKKLENMVSSAQT